MIYTTTNGQGAAAQKVQAAFLQIDNVSFDTSAITSGQNTNILLECDLCVDFRLTNSYFADGGGLGYGVFLNQSKHLIITNNQFRNWANSTTVGGLNANAVSFAAATSDFIFANNDIYKMGQVPITTRSHHGVVVNNTCEGAEDQCFSTHGAGVHWVTIAHNQLSGLAQTTGTADSTGIFVGNQGSGPQDGDGDITVEANEISHYGSQCIEVFSSRVGAAVGDMRNIKIKGNHCRYPVNNSNGGDSYLVNYVLGLDLEGNTTEDVLTNNNGFNLQFLDRFSIINNKATQTRLTSGPGAVTGANGFYIANAKHGEITSNHANGFDQRGFFFDTSIGGAGAIDTITMTGNEAYSNTVANYYFGTTPANITNLIRDNNINDPLTLTGTGSSINVSTTVTPVVGNCAKWTAANQVGDQGTVCGGSTTVTFSATPTFSAATADHFKITLTGNVSSSTLSGAVAGQPLYFQICQDATGSRTFVWPSNMKGTTTIGSIASTCTAQGFVFDGTNAYALAAGVPNQ